MSCGGAEYDLGCQCEYCKRRESHERAENARARAEMRCRWCDRRCDREYCSVECERFSVHARSRLAERHRAIERQDVEQPLARAWAEVAARLAEPDVNEAVLSLPDGRTLRVSKATITAAIAPKPSAPAPSPHRHIRFREDD